MSAHQFRKIFKLVEEVSVSEWKDLDAEVIDVMQKWDLNTGGTLRKAATNAASGPGASIASLVTPYEKTFSFFTNRIYIEALLRKKKFEDFFATCMDISFVNHDSANNLVIFRI